MSAGAITFWVVGFAFAHGQTEEGGSYIGTNYRYFMANDLKSVEKNQYPKWVFMFTFAANSATIVSGALAERTQLLAYTGFSVFMTGIIYPIVVSWTWGRGWLGNQNVNALGFTDFAGSGIVHMVGGMAGLTGAAILGVRHGKERKIEDKRDYKKEAEY